MVEIRNATVEQIQEALDIVNERYEGNIKFKRFDSKHTRHGARSTVTLTVKDSHAPGHRRGFSFGDRPAKRVAAACWHVHGHFFDALLKVCPDAVIISRGRGRSGELSIDKNGGNWIDYNAGSVMLPVPMSEMCDCED
jgi:hypothetical protein